ncbi:MAG: tRNA pseudouridine(38-40) synthase TruA [Candidatus Shikimatogenerans bostrichidophilus]|nr:MAG: tRNA pseudouridine(38-40) synthase TruA [Candidatus Shikimatogenerans bostrichidophilus]
MRYLIKLSYNGNYYHGWQKQPNTSKTIEEEIENKLYIILRKKINIIGASRTDSGVHANIMFAHFDYNSLIEKKWFLYKINLLISSNINIKNIYQIKDNIHARYNAKYRIYKYYISYFKYPFLNKLYWYWYYNKNINIKSMNKAIRIIINRKYFNLFTIKDRNSSKNKQKYKCNIYYAYWIKYKNNILFKIKSNRFLRKMIRIIISICIEIGIKKKTINELINEIKNNNIKYNINVPTYGLYLNKIKYNKNIYL